VIFFSAVIMRQPPPGGNPLARVGHLPRPGSALAAANA
jgi:hypothetical protein